MRGRKDGRLAQQQPGQLLTVHSDEADDFVRAVPRHIGIALEELAVHEVMATAILDHLLHDSHVLNIKGRSYRLRDLEQAVNLQPCPASQTHVPASQHRMSCYLVRTDIA